jgi:hypothetical protein
MLDLETFQTENVQAQTERKNELNALKLRRQKLTRQMSKTIAEIARLESVRGAFLLDERAEAVTENTRALAAQADIKRDLELQTKELDARIVAKVEEIFNLENERRKSYRAEINRQHAQKQIAFAAIKKTYEATRAELNALGLHKRALDIDGTEHFANTKMGFITPLIESAPIPNDD